MSFQNEFQTTANSYRHGSVWIICIQGLARRFQSLHTHRARYSISKGALSPHLELELNALVGQRLGREDGLKEKKAWPCLFSNFQSRPRAFKMEWNPVLLNHILSSRFDLGTSSFVSTPTESLVSIGSRRHKNWTKKWIRTKRNPQSLRNYALLEIQGTLHPSSIPDLPSLASCNVLRNLWGSHKPKTIQGGEL